MGVVTLLNSDDRSRLRKGSVIDVEVRIVVAVADSRVQ
jgi:hypothetical protein